LVHGIFLLAGYLPSAYDEVIFPKK